MSTIQIIFLPRAVGYIETTLTVRTLPRTRDSPACVIDFFCRRDKGGLSVGLILLGLVMPIDAAARPIHHQISTSEGDIAYGVQANPVLNIYRLAPIIQSRVSERAHGSYPCTRVSVSRWHTDRGCLAP